MNTERIRRVNPIFLAVFGGVLSALLALFPLNFSIISFLLTYFAALPLYIIGLGWGIHKLILSGMIAIGIFMIGVGIHGGFVFMLTTFLPAALITLRLQKGDYAGHIVSWITALSITIFLAVTFILSSQSVNILDTLQSWFSLFTDESSVKDMSNWVISLLPALSSISWVMMCLLNASLAARLLTRAQLIQRYYPVPEDSQLHENWDIVLISSLLLMTTTNPLLTFMGKNIALISCIPLFLVGLKVAHAWLEQFDTPKLWMVIIVFMSIFLVWPGIVIVIFGVLEPTLHLRQKWASNRKVDR